MSQTKLRHPKQHGLIKRYGYDFILHGGMKNEKKVFSVVIGRSNGRRQPLPADACHGTGG